jgi:hypothetical protein
MVRTSKTPCDSGLVLQKILPVELLESELCALLALVQLARIHADLALTSPVRLCEPAYATI